MPNYTRGQSQNIYPNPAYKHMMAFQNFGGGMNSVTSNDNLADSEFPMLKNVDLRERGSITRRYGFLPFFIPRIQGNGQGYFRYYRGTNDFDEIVALDGKLYKNNEILPIEGLNEFQKERSIEAVQMGDKLYIATGTKLVVYDGEKAKVVEPYRPQPLEGLYVGTNALADNPSDYMQDGVSSFPRIDGVTFKERYGVSGQPIHINVWVSVPQGSQLEYKFSFRLSSHKEGEWPTQSNWQSEKIYTLETTWQGDLEVRVQMRDKNDPTEEVDSYDAEGNPIKITQDKVISEYYVPKYVIKGAPDPSDKEIDTATIHQCNRILVHWNRLVLYGDPKQPDIIYISHLNRGDYFPTPNSLQFTNGKQEGLSKLIRYRDMLIGFTATSIQGLFGKSPSDYSRIMLNSDVGAIAPESVSVMQNYVVFLSQEGVMLLKSVGQVLDKANVEKLDTYIQNLVPTDTNAVGVVHDGQYRLVFPSKGIGFRYYYDQKVWVMDESSQFQFDRFYIYDTFLFAQNKNTGHVVLFKDDVFDDEGHVFEVRVDSKYFDFGQPYNPKKLKEIQVMLAKEKEDDSVNVYIYADKERVWNVAEEDETSDRDMWKIGKAYYENQNSAIYRLRLSGKARQSKFVLTQKENKPFSLYGFGYKYKVKAP